MRSVYASEYLRLELQRMKTQRKKSGERTVFKEGGLT